MRLKYNLQNCTWWTARPEYATVIPGIGCLGGAAVRVGLVIERPLVRLPAGALSSQLGQLSLPSFRGR